MYGSWSPTGPSHVRIYQPITTLTTIDYDDDSPARLNEQEQHSAVSFSFRNTRIVAMTSVNKLYAPVSYRWAHAVNSEAALEAALANNCSSMVNAIEADIIFSDKQQVPVMGHPPQQDSTLTLEQFLHTLAQARFQGGNDHKATLVKLDFKSQVAFEASLALVQSYVRETQFPQGLFWNADFLLGPMQDIVDRQRYGPQFSGSAFLAMAQQTVPDAVLSIGWTTTPHEQDQELAYTEKMVTEMLNMLQVHDSEKGTNNNANTMTVTFPIRATSFRSSWHVLERLYAANPKYGITLWWSKSMMSMEELKWIYATLEGESSPYQGRTYYDILGFEQVLKDGKR
eukprot:scaffold1708_cov61-Attheya_sp.AAC.1